jgi:hypothetical protein
MIEKIKKYKLKEFYENFLEIGKSIWEEFQKEAIKENKRNLLFFSFNGRRLSFVHMKIT